MNSTLATAVPGARRLTAGPGSPWLLAVGVLFAAVVALWPSWYAIHGFWVDSSRYSHGYLVAAICLYLVYRRRPEVDGKTARPSLLGAAGLAGLLVIWLIAVLGSVQAIHLIVLPAILWTGCLAVLGWRVAWQLLVPVGYLYLAVPIWESGNFALQFLTVQAVGFALGLADIPAFIYGNFVSLPAGSFEIASGCSGLHFLIISFAISILYAWLYLKTLRRSLLLVALVVAAALLTNWLRVFIVIVAGHVTDMQHYLVTEDHYYFGWALYAIAMAPVLWFARRLEVADLREAGTAAPVMPRQAVGRAVWPMFGLVIGMLVVSSVLIYAKMPAGGERYAEIEMPASVAPWDRADGQLEEWKPYFAGVDDERQANYSDGERVVTVYRNVYLSQSQGRELIGYENRVAGDGDRWRAVSNSVTKLAPNAAVPMAFKVTELVAPNGARRVVLYRYDVGGRFFVSELRAKLHYGVAVMAGRPESGAQVLSARCTDDCRQAIASIGDWLAAHADSRTSTTSPR